MLFPLLIHDLQLGFHLLVPLFQLCQVLIIRCVLELRMLQFADRFESLDASSGCEHIDSVAVLRRSINIIEWLASFPFAFEPRVVTDLVDRTCCHCRRLYVY